MQSTQERPEGPMDEDELGLALSTDLNDACNFIDFEIGPLRAAAIHYYRGRGFGDEEDGRSQVVMPEVRDNIRATLPSLMKKFFGSKRVVTFSSGSTGGGAFADDATATVEYVFTVQNPGYQILWNAFKDALRSKTGWLKWWWDESVKVSAKDYSGVTEQQVHDAHATLRPTEHLEVLGKYVAAMQTVMVPAPQMAQPPQAPQAQPENGEGLQMPGPNGGLMPSPAPAQGNAGAQPSMAPSIGSGPSPTPPGAPAPLVPQQVPVYLYNIRITCKEPRREVRVACVPPDEIVFVRDGWDYTNCRLIAHRTRKTRGELVEMGVDPADLVGLPEDDVSGLTNIEFLARQTIPDSVVLEPQAPTWDQDRTMYYECYYRVDQDGDGISELRKICRLGKDGKIVSNKIVDEVPLALLCPDPEPHVIVGNSQADFIMDMQNIKSHVWRDLLDSLKQSIFPRTAYVEGQASLDDILNSEIGAAIRMRQPGMVQPLVVPFTGQNAFPLLEQLDQVVERRTGVGAAAMALDGSALQSTTPVAAAATVSAAQSQVELTCRLFADGVARMFRGILRLLVENQDQEMQFELNGRTFNVNPLTWNPDLNTIVDTGLGQGQNVSEMLEMFDGVATAQKALIDQFGPENPLAGLQEYYNTVRSMMELSGVRDTQRFWLDPSKAKQTGKQIAPPPPSPEQIAADAQKAIEAKKLEKDRLVIILEDLRKRDQMLIDAHLKVMAINAQYGAKFDTKVIDHIIAREKNLSNESIATTPSPDAAPAAS